MDTAKKGPGVVEITEEWQQQSGYHSIFKLCESLKRTALSMSTET